jgi:hypothetical protein
VEYPELRADHKQRASIFFGGNEMRTTIMSLAIIVGFATQCAHADIVRHASIPKSFWGKWAATVDDCDKAGKYSVVLSAKAYVSMERSCTVDWVAESPGRAAPIYSAHLLCAVAGDPSKKIISNVMLQQDNSSQISTGVDFKSLEPLQRCSTN